MLQMDMFRSTAKTRINIKVEPTTFTEGRLHVVSFAFMTQSDMIDFMNNVVDTVEQYCGVCVHTPQLKVVDQQ